MKIAIVCDDLIQNGGQERLILGVLEMWPDAPICASVISKEWQKRLKEMKRTYFTSFLQKFPFIEKINRYYSPFLLHILAFESFNFDKFDVVLSISSRYAHFVITKPETGHICYMNTPGRMFWEQADYFAKETYGKLRPLKILAIPFLSPFLSLIRQLDYAASHRVDYFIANSKTAQSRINKYYGRDSVVINPFIDTNKFKNIKSVYGEFYLVITRLVSWKRVDIAVEACEQLGFDLHVIGDGPDLERLKKISNGKTRFLGYADDSSKLIELSGCKALINTQKEDFGVVPLEAMVCGKPVIAYGKGGVLETVVPGVTGEFIKKQTSEALAELLKDFSPSKYRKEECVKQALKFEKRNFEASLKEFVELA